MGYLLSFLAENIAIIIRILSVVVALASGFLLYRLIFVSREEVSAAEATDQGVLAKKITEQKTELDSLKTENTIVKTELETHRTEVYNLRQTVKEKEAEVEAAKSEIASMASSVEAAAAALKTRDYEMHKSEIILSSKDEKLLFEKEISELKRRLSDYEIIAEDIADMQRLKEENEQLKQQVGHAGASAHDPKVAAEAVPVSRTEESSTAVSDSALELDALDSALADAEIKLETTVRADGTIVETEALGPGPEEASKLATEEPTPSAPTASNDGIGESEKSLMEKFERQKGS